MILIHSFDIQFQIGSDYSSNLANICRSRGFETCVADVTCLPFRSNSFDIVLCIAVIHHMATQVDFDTFCGLFVMIVWCIAVIHHMAGILSVIMIVQGCCDVKFVTF